METPTKEENKTTEEESTSVKRKKVVSTFKSALVFLSSFFVELSEALRESESESEKTIPTEEEYHALQAEVEAYTKRGIASTFLPALLVGLLAFYLFSAYSEIATKPLIIRVVLAIFSSVCLIYLRELSISEKQQKIRMYELSHAQEEVEEDLFKNSIQISYKYLDQYYAQTRKQAEKGFLITVIVAFSGAILIFGGVGFLLFGDSEKITPAYITCASGAITEFISAVFFYLYNKTVTSMNSYHDKLVLSQNVAFALRIAGEMEGIGEKNKAKLAIINELVKDVNAQMMKSDADTETPPKKDKPSDSDTPSG